MRHSAELQATNNVFQSRYKMDFWPAGAIMAEDQVDGWLAGDGREMAGGGLELEDKSGRCNCLATISRVTRMDLSVLASW